LPVANTSTNESRTTCSSPRLATAKVTPPPPSFAEHETFMPKDRPICNMFQMGPLTGTSVNPPDAIHANAAQQRRPRGAEPFRQQDRDDIIQRPVPPPGYFHQPQHRIGSASFSMTISQLVTLYRNPDLPNFLTASEALFNHKGDDSQALHSLTQAVVNAAAELQTPSHANLHYAEGGETDCVNALTTATNSENSNELRASMMRTEDIGTVPIFTLLTPSMTISDSTPQHMQQPYLQAALAKVPTFTMPTASMPNFKFQFLDTSHKPSINRIAFLDTGCNVNLMSEKTLQRDMHFFGPKAKVKQIKPFNVCLADGKSQSMTLKAVTDVQIVIGKVWYPASFLIVSNLATDYIMGFPFMYQFNIQIKPSESKFAIGIPAKNVLQPIPNDKTYQTRDLSFSTKRMTLVEV
jgi:hypothetical protein